MTLKREVRAAFEAMERAFPYDEYNDESVYHELCEVVVRETFEPLASIRLRPPLRQAFLALATLFPTFRSGLLVVARKPATWNPLQVTEETARERVAGSRSVPMGVQ